MTESVVCLGRLLKGGLRLRDLDLECSPKIAVWAQVVLLKEAPIFALPSSLLFLVTIARSKLRKNGADVAA